jgi:hypothetical protein
MASDDVLPDAPPSALAGAPLTTCTVCGTPTTVRCPKCVSEDITQDIGHREPTRYYCNTTCQTIDWENHKGSCKLAQAQKKLFRGAEVLQEVFLAVREETFDTAIETVAISNDGENLHIFDPTDGPEETIPVQVGWDLDLRVKRMILSHRSGDNALSGMMYKLAKDTLRGTLTPEFKQYAA